MLRPLLQKALLALPAEQREVFVLREQAGVPFKEIAEILGVNENTVKSRMRYALEGLRKSLAAAGVDAETAASEPAAGVRLT
jgi:RNA polymerase sigma-70 factor (ECF subfamily)